jgi:myo-inositol-1(or 4)-monophosphatase
MEVTKRHEAMNVASRTQLPLQAPDLAAREALCRDMILAAGGMAMDGFRAMKAGAMAMKGPQDFLTETDGQVERYLRGRIAEAFPQDGFLGEETGGVPGDDLWVIDPIDGTANFARQIAHFCISIAFVSGGRVEIGAIYNPGMDELHFARRGQGATRNGSPIHVANTVDYQRACVELGWSTRLPNATYLAVLDRILENGANVRRAASGALGLAFVADGRSDGYAELHMHAWDCLAGLLLVREAGGVTAPFLERDGLSKGGGVLAACPGIAPGMSAATGIALTL